MAKVGQKHEDAVSAVQDCLKSATTGCLRGTGKDGSAYQVYFMNGDLLAAHGPADGAQVVNRLVNSGALTPRQGEGAQAGLRDGELLESIVDGSVPDELLYELLHERFRQNIFDFLLTDPPHALEEMDAVFVDNLQVGHDSVALVDELWAQAYQTRPLLDRAPDLVMKPGPMPPASQDEARLLDICDPSMPLNELLASSPYENGPTVALVKEMIDRSAMVIEGAEDEARKTIKRKPKDIAEQTLDVWLDEVVDARKKSLEQPPPADDWNDDPITGVWDGVHAEAEDPLEAPTEPELTLDADPTEDIPRVSEDPEDLALDDDVGVTSDAAKSFHDAVTNAASEFLDESELSMFGDYDQGRGGAEDGLFTSEILDKVELGRPIEDLSDLQDEVIEVMEAGDIEGDVASISFTGPELEEDDTRHKFTVCNEVLGRVANAMDTQNGPGSGRACMQLLIDGTPSEFAVLFPGVEVDINGSINIDRVIRNLEKRPVPERRRLVNRGVRDLIERALSQTFEELGDEAVDNVMQQVAGYEKRLGL